MIVKLNGHPCSVNKAYATLFRTKRRIKTRDYHAFERMVQSAWVDSRFEIKPEMRLKVQIIIDGSWFTKQKKIRKVDLDNFAKVTLDCLSKLLGFEDSQIFELQMTKREYQVDQTLIVIDEILQ